MRSNLASSAVGLGMLTLLTCGVLFLDTYGDALFPCLGLWVVGWILIMFGVSVSSSPASARTLPGTKAPEPSYKWYKAKREEYCSDCGTTIPIGERYWARWLFDPVEGHWSNGDDHLCEWCTRTREDAEALGVEGIGERYAHGDITEEVRDRMLTYAGVTP